MRFLLVVVSDCVAGKRGHELLAKLGTGCEIEEKLGARHDTDYKFLKQKEFSSRNWDYNYI